MKKLFAIYDKTEQQLMTEGDVSNAPSDAPIIKDEDSKWELQAIIDDHGGDNVCLIIEVKVVPVPLNAA